MPTSHDTTQKYTKPIFSEKKFNEYAGFVNEIRFFINEREAYIA